MLTAVIPTRNRPDDLVKAVRSVCTQSLLPDELVIVDQSFSADSRIQIEAIIQEMSAIQLIYIHDANISGLVEAKHVAVNVSNGDLI